MVQGIEEDLGLSDLGNIEKRVLLSIIEFHDQNGVASTAEILAHPLLTTFSRPSLFRALKLLEETGRILKYPTSEVSTLQRKTLAPAFRRSENQYF